jgi:ABC-type nitrate/sulfonate/bicarbonate transport system ATPase subunit
MIELCALSVSYDNQGQMIPALSNINMTIPTGDIYAFIGPSGCGKSTLLFVLSGLLKKYNGTVSMDGSPIDPSIQKIGLVLQNDGLLPWITVRENLTLGLKIKHESLQKYSLIINEMIDVLKLHPLLDRYPQQLSGGQRQRVALGRTFIFQPTVLLMDEPFSALDAVTREEMQNLFMKLWKDTPATGVFVTHSLEEAVCVGKKIVILSPAPGKVINIIHNPLFGISDLRLQPSFYDFCLKLRREINHEWIK